ncbi:MULTISPECIES: hypothetical protein [Paenibacillus]|uniref:hypothetical protein n=1 Tax=Paenibacillus TaxID=44249 RepID=UPI001575AC1A|nr:hypothetical protein [Paenibacillus sp. JMULE4]NTZ19911.1 hypothetical protein [Paenibacillus sp. JMULE4]
MAEEANARRPPQDSLGEKRKFHPKADSLNMIGERQGKPALLCGAKRKNKDARCRQYAGAGTDHSGYGRCKFCAGRSTGPRTPEGKAVVAQNPRKHGFYSPALYGAECETYEQLRANGVVSLEDEIFMWKAKLLTYLQKWERIRQEKGEEATRVWFKDGHERAYYYAGTAEDRVVSRNLETLGRLVEKYARLRPDDGEDLLSQINTELRAASKAQIAITWSGPAQQRLTSEEAGK